MAEREYDVDDREDVESGGVAPSTLVDGTIAKNDETGETIIWRISPGGRGRWLTFDPMSALRNDQEKTALTQSESAIRTLNELAIRAERFDRQNRIPRRSPVDAGGETGGTAGLPVDQIPVLGFFSDAMKNRTRQAMESETSGMVRSQIREGTSGTMNSIPEQALARQQYPDVQTDGRENRRRVLNILADRDEAIAYQEARLAHIARRGTIAGFDANWARTRSRQVRAESIRRHNQRLAQEQRAENDRRAGRTPAANGEEPLYNTRGQRVR